jgi:hypothetical protein
VLSQTRCKSAVLGTNLEFVCEAVKGLPQIGSAPSELVLHTLSLSMTYGRAFDADATLVPELALSREALRLVSVTGQGTTC